MERAVGHEAQMGSPLCQFLSQHRESPLEIIGHGFEAFERFVGCNRGAGMLVQRFAELGDAQTEHIGLERTLLNRQR